MLKLLQNFNNFRIYLNTSFIWCNKWWWFTSYNFAVTRATLFTLFKGSFHILRTDPTSSFTLSWFSNGPISYNRPKTLSSKAESQTRLDRTYVLYLNNCASQLRNHTNQSGIFPKSFPFDNSKREIWKFEKFTA